MSFTLFLAFLGVHVVALLAWGGVGLARAVKDRRPAELSHCLALLAGLVVVGMGAMLAIFVTSWLSHSEAVKARAPALGVAAFVLVGVIPGAAVVRLYRRGQRAARAEPPPGA